MSHSSQNSSKCGVFHPISRTDTSPVSYTQVGKGAHQKVTPYRHPSPITEMVVGYQATSYCDWPSKISAVLFLKGCNLFCPTCHNWHIAHPNVPLPYIDIDQITQNIRMHSKWLDGIVISGGEALIHQNLYKLIYHLHVMCRLPIKLDTNGMDPDALSELLTSQRYVTTVAMDIKAPWKKYPSATGCKQKDPEYFEHLIMESINVVMAQPNTDIYFRTTLVPDLTKEDIQEIKSYLPKDKVHRLQTYRPTDHATP